MKHHIFWLVSLICLVIVAVALRWCLPIRIAVAANAVVVFLNAFSTVKGWMHDAGNKA